MEKVHASQKEEASANNDLKNELAALKTHHEASQAELKAKVDEANTAVTKLKESIQGILKKVKEEFTALKTETGTGMEGLKKDIDVLKAHPVADVKPNPASNDDLINLKKETEETKTNLNKLKDNV